MALLPNSRHELFARAVASGKSAMEAYAQAGYAKSSAKSNACRLMENEGIRARITELQTASAKKTEITLESLLADADRIQQQAEALGQTSAASSALKLKSELSGFYAQRIKSEAKVETTSSVLQSVIAQLLAKGDGEVQVVAATGSGTVVRFRESQGKRTYLVPTNVAGAHTVLPEPIPDAEEWLEQHVPEAHAPPVAAPGSDKVN